MTNRVNHNDLTRNTIDVACRYVQTGIVLVLAILGLTGPDRNTLPETLIEAECWAIVVLYVWSAWTWIRVMHRLFDWYLIFLTGAFAFNAGHAFLEVLKANRSGILDGEFNSSIIIQTLYMVLLSLSAMHCGALFSVIRIPPKRVDDRKFFAASPEMLTSMRLIGSGLLMISFPFAAILLKNAVDVVLSGGYFALYQQAAATGLGAGPNVMAFFLIPGVMFLLAASSGIRTLQFFSISVVLGYAMTNFFLGVRHEGAILLTAVTWIWDRLIGRLNFFFLIACGTFALFVLFPLVAATRNVSGTDRVSASFLIDQFTSLDNPMVSSIHEIGGTMSVIAHTLMLVPNSHRYEKGVGYGYALLTAFPNLWNGVHPSIARKIPSSWLVWEIDPYFANQGGTIGFSFIAEAYLNFGWTGLVPVMFFGGFFGASVVRWVEFSGRADRAAFLATAAYFFVFYVRAELAVVTRGLVWYACLPYMAVQILTLAQHALNGQRAFRNRIEITSQSPHLQTSLQKVSSQ